MVLRGHQIKDILKLKHVPKTKTTIHYHKTGGIVIIEPLSIGKMITSFSHFRVTLIEVDTTIPN